MTRSECAWLALQRATPALILVAVLFAIVAWQTRNRD